MAELVDALVLGTSVNDVGVRVPSSAPMIYLFELIKQIIKNHSVLNDFFACKNIIQEKMAFKIKIIKEEKQSNKIKILTDMFFYRKCRTSFCNSATTICFFIYNKYNKMNLGGISYVRRHCLLCARK